MGGAALKSTTISKTFNNETYYLITMYDSTYSYPIIYNGDTPNTIIRYKLVLTNIVLSMESSSILYFKVYTNSYVNTLQIYGYNNKSSGNYRLYGSVGSSSISDTVTSDDISIYPGALYLDTNNSVVTVISGTLTYTVYYI